MSSQREGSTSSDRAWLGAAVLALVAAAGGYACTGQRVVTPPANSTDGGVCTTLCASRCVDLTADDSNCGACGKACGTGKHCVAGGCAYTGCTSNTECDDRISCTLDTCVAGACLHAVGPNTGATACGAGQFCLLGKGCIKGKACGSNADCIDTDPCTVHETCQAATAICTYEALDKDGDGHPPVVCGGDDCDDADPDRFPTHPEVCDGKDNGCTGAVDVGAACASKYQACMGGVCQCKTENQCGSPRNCIDNDPTNCGKCGHNCGVASTCKDGVCGCNVGLMSCGGACVDLQRDVKNCGACGTDCGANAACSQGSCRCVAQATDCGGGECILTDTDAMNCGGCGMACSGTVDCVGGECQFTCAGILSCTNACAGNNNCYDACIARGTARGNQLWDALGACVDAACPGNVQNDPCWNPQSQACSTCWSTSQKKGGACYNSLLACANDV